MNDLEKYFASNSRNLIHKWAHYFDIYDRHFSRFRGTEVHVLEIGVRHGGSLQMWKHYFGGGARIYGVDINPHCQQLEEQQIRIFIGDQADRRFLHSLAERIPRIDILIDDGGHSMEEQRTTFEVLFPRVDKYGVYLCEDLHTSYWKRYGGGYHRRGTFIEYSKNFIDLLHAWHSEQPGRLAVTDFTRSAYSLHYYDSILVIEKRPMEKPYDLQTGYPRVAAFSVARPSFLERVARQTWMERLLEFLLEIGLQRRRPGAMPAFAPDRVQRILVVRKDNIGDVLCTTPALRALRRAFPTAHLAILVAEHCRAAVTGNPDVDEVLTYTKAKHRGGLRGLSALAALARLIQELRTRRFDLAIGMGRPCRRSTAWLAYATGARWRLGYRSAGLHPFPFFLNLGRECEATLSHEVDGCLNLLAALAVRPAGRELSLIPNPAVRSAVWGRLAAAGVRGGEPLAIVHISNRRETSRWPLPAFAEAADFLRERMGLRVVLSWAPGDAANPLFPGDDGQAEEVAGRMRSRPILLRTPTLEELIAAVSLSDFLLSTDGGPMHIAAALDIPQVVLFGGTDPVQWAPVSQRSAILFGQGRVDRISVEEVMKATEAVLSRSGGMRAPSAARFPDTMQAVPKGKG